MALEEPIFLTLADVIEIHKNQIRLFGGDYGIRDIHLLQSALAQPEASFGGEWLHADIFEMASAYAFHICQNHPFIDGNKRAALQAAVVFLEINRCGIKDPHEALFTATLKMASSRMSKAQFAEVLRKLPKG